MVKIPAKSRIQGKFGIPLEAFPEDIRDLMTDYKKNRDEIIKRMKGRPLYAVISVDFSDQDGKEYTQRFKINILTMKMEKLDEGPLNITMGQDITMDK